jgi:hypothetical protein
MSTIAIAVLQTPWDCRWSRFGRMRSRGPNRPAEGLWVCVHGNGAGRPIDVSECETCPYWEYEPPLESLVERLKPESVASRSTVHAGAVVVEGLNEWGG